MEKTKFRELSKELIANGVRIIENSNTVYNDPKNKLRRALIDLITDKKYFEDSETEEISDAFEKKYDGSIPNLGKFETCYLISAIHEQTLHGLKNSDLNNSGSKTVERKITGSFFTPRHVSENIVAASVEKWFNQNEKIPNFIDPCCGGGVFLVSFLKRVEETTEEELEELGDYVYGVDLSEEAVETTKVVLSHLTGSSVSKFDNQIKEGNSLVSKNIFSNESLASHINQSIDLEEYFTDPEKKKPFSWESQFEIIFGENEGFDILCMNPPYKRLKANKDEFESEEKYEARKKDVKEEKEYFKSSKDYDASIGRSLNYYTLMLERSLDLVNSNGEIGFVCPLTVTLDKSTYQVRELLINNGLFRVVNYSEKANLFGPNVSQAVTIMNLSVGIESQNIDISPMMDSWNQNPKRIEVNLDLINSLSEYSYLPSASVESWNILSDIHEAPRISEIEEIVQYRGECDLSKFSELLDYSGTAKLIRGSHISEYAVEFNEKKKSFIDRDKFIEANKTSNKIKYIGERRLICQQISNLSNDKRLKFAMISEDSIVSNSCNFLHSKSPYSEEYMLGLLNSVLLDWRFRLTSSNNHINNYELKDLPIADPNGEKKGEIEKLVRKQLEDYSKERQLKIDLLVFDQYGLSSEEAVEICKLVDSERYHDLKKLVENR